MLLLWPGWVRRKREDDFGRIGPALFAGTNNSDLSIDKISSTSYSEYHILYMREFIMEASNYIRPFAHLYLYHFCKLQKFL